MMKKIVLAALILTLFLTLTACSGIAKKSGMTIYAPADRMEAVKEGFGKYFEIATIDSSATEQQQGQERYALVFEGASESEKVGIPDGGFLLLVDDSQTPIQITIRYQSGAQGSGAAVINRNILKGSAEITKNVGFSPKEDSTTPKDELIASAIYDLLKDIEGK